MYLLSNSYELIFYVWYNISRLLCSYHCLVYGESSLILNFLEENKRWGFSLSGDGCLFFCFYCYLLLKILTRSPMSFPFKLSKSIYLCPDCLLISDDNYLFSFKALNIRPAVEFDLTSLGPGVKKPGFWKACSTFFSWDWGSDIWFLSNIFLRLLEPSSCCDLIFWGVVRTAPNFTNS